MSFNATLDNLSFISTFLEEGFLVLRRFVYYSFKNLRPNYVPQKLGAKSTPPAAVGRWTIHVFTDPSRVLSPLRLLEDLS